MTELVDLAKPPSPEADEICDEEDPLFPRHAVSHHLLARPAACNVLAANVPECAAEAVNGED